jgi:hypothetical protein
MERQERSDWTAAGGAEGGIGLAETLVAATAANPPATSQLRIVSNLRPAARSLSRDPFSAQAAAVAKLIHGIDNFPFVNGLALPASWWFTYHKLQFGEVAFAVPQQPCPWCG